MAEEVRRLASELRPAGGGSTSAERSEKPVPRVTVTTDPLEGEPPRTLMDEFVDPIHLESEHSADQFVERLGWAIVEAENGYPVAPRPRRPARTGGRA